MQAVTRLITLNEKSNYIKLRAPDIQSWSECFLVYIKTAWKVFCFSVSSFSLFIKS